MLYIKKRYEYLIVGASLAAAVSIFVAIVALGIYVPFRMYGEYIIPLDNKVNTYIAVALLVAMLPASIVGFFNLRYKKAVEKNVPRFLRSLMDDVHSGMTLPRALEMASERDFGPITDETQIALSKFILGKKFDDAMMEMGEKLQNPQARQVATILNEANSSGGRVSEVLSTATDMYSQLNEYREDRRSKMKPYTYLIYMAVLIFLIITYISLEQFLRPLSTASTTATPLLKQFLPISYYESIFFWAANIEGLLGGLVGGKISEGTVSGGLLHAAVLVAICVVFFNIFVF
ncbi:MAG: hypothetical protein GTN80_09120 [Nitrososphaeria archaeon]|nr:hypothetical protein [Nitrososphaeria archaeon]NIN53327.1 hypothetical protein [Nitrososphaeria archaeon]NIQ33780.1 hypothetical protein [Nitrososphaeria archaeon]